MSANTKTVLKGFDYMHCDDFAKYLSDMATKGWHFKEWGVGLKFEKGEPEHVTYAVEVFTKASENDMRPEPHTQEFAEYCEAAGWKLIDAKQKFCIFKKVDENAVELFTPEERVGNSFKAMMSGSAITLFVLYGINALLQWSNIFNRFEQYVFSGLYLFSFSTWNVMFLGQLCTFFYTFWKRYTMLKNVKEGKEIYLGSLKNGRFQIRIKDIYVLILFLMLFYSLFVMDRIELILVIVIVIGITLSFSIVIAKVRPESNANFALQIIFSLVLLVTLIIFTTATIFENENVSLEKDKLPLQISDYRECTEIIQDVDIYHDANFLGSVDTYYIFGTENSVYYDIYQSSNMKILDKIWEEELDGKYNDGVTDCTTEWEATQALRNELGTYYVRYEDAILVFSDDKDVYLTIDQINIIRDKLDLR